MAEKNKFAAIGKLASGILPGESATTKTSAKDRYNEAKEIAGATAVNKASLANKQAKQAAALSNNSKMTQALLGAQAATDAVAQGYDEGIDRGANMAAQIASEEAREKEREQNQRQFEASQRQQKEEAEKDRKFQKKENNKQRKSNMVNSIVSSLTSKFF